MPSDDCNKASSKDDPDGAPRADAGFFGYSCSRAEATFVLLPIPFEATVSYRRGTARAPDAIRRASHQVDLFDLSVGDLRSLGWTVDDLGLDLLSISDAAHAAAGRARQQKGPARTRALLEVEQAFATFAEPLFQSVQRTLREKKIPIVIGGEHAVALPALRAALKTEPALGILQIDAHADLRLAYEGFAYSHASVMRHLFTPQVFTPQGDPDSESPTAPCPTLLQVGVRDFCEEELNVIRRHQIAVCFDRDLADARLAGTLPALFDRLIASLPQNIWLSCDIDGLDPALCPQTGTPVPGGLRWDEISLLLEKLGQARNLVGADLVEVSPGHPAPDTDTWDAVVGARLLYRIMGAAAGRSRPGLPSATTPRRLS